MSKSRLLRKWEEAASDLALDIVTPFEVDLGNKRHLPVEFLVKNFGARNGMLIVTDYALIKPHLEKLESLGYGFSVFDEPRDPAGEVYDRDIFIHILSDWGWTGIEANRPAWLIDSD